MKHATSSGPYKVPKEHDGLRSVTMAVAMHALLILFLWVGVHWQSNEPVAVEAEVWDMKVQEAAPPAPPASEAEPEPAPEVKPPPAPMAPPDEVKPEPKAPDIALERLKARLKAEKEKQEELKKEQLKKEQLRKEEEKQAKLKAEKEKAEKEKAEKKLEEQKAKEEKEKKEKKEQAEKKLKADKEAKAKADKAAEKARAAEMSRITGAVGAGTSGTAAKSTGPRSDGGYEAAIRGKIKSNLVYSGTDDTLKASFHIAQLPTGEIISVRKTKGSGNAAYDTAVENAIWKSSPLPKKKDGTVVRDFDTDFNMKDLH
ncbi:cell envelope integrity protein TolA [Duganella sp. FT3S]|uniref:Cell envelope integrity protein TolA n=1 Tax=Rugamonas fusca TaxID=2758568 RepID=A0A7W2EHZ7_9BURK|nr:cell envelope integrity protein TolA [Rugamonas fusca]MBA5606277.1 cell envelope integrity protein TolA [Rugamonas fusca]